MNLSQQITKPATTRFTVLVPTFNEANHIKRCLESLLAQIPEDRGELLMIDGGSTDDTLVIAATLTKCYSTLKIVHNPARLQSAGCNLGAEFAAPQSTALVRADAHAFYPGNFLDLCLSALETKDATSVVVPMKTLGEKALQRAIAAAQNSVLGNGGSRHRRQSMSCYVEHGHHAAFDRRFFELIGGYDATFSHNEDAELDVRAAAAGGRIWLCTEATIEYFPRSNFAALARQYARHGAGRARTVLKHRQRPKLRQLLPLGVLVSCALAIAGLSHPQLALPLLLYVTICLIWSIGLAFRHRDIALVLSGPAAVVMHISWGVGFLRFTLNSILSSHD